MSTLDMNLVYDVVDKWLGDNELFGSKPEMIWTDLETTGLDHDGEKILEVTFFVTDSYGFLVQGGMRSWVVQQSEDVLKAVEEDAIVGPMHTASGLLADLREYNNPSLEVVEEQAIEFIKKHVGDTKLPLAGSNVANFDRRWIAAHMPQLNETFHYRNIDISTLKELARITNPRLLDFLAEGVKPMRAHRGTPDLIDSIGEYRFYLAEFLWTRDDSKRVSL